MINKETLFRIFAEREDKFSVSPLPRYCRADALKYLEYKEILAITGVRRSGKTYLLYDLIGHLIQSGVPQASILYLNFEDERLAFIEPSDLEKIYEWFLEFSNPTGKLYFFLDEIQNVPLWEKWLARMYEKVKFVVTGSNSRLLSSEIATALTGRSIELTLYPFSFREYLTFRDRECLDGSKIHRAETTAAIYRYLTEYFDRGGFPEVLLHDKTDLLPEYYKSILLRDIIARYNIRHKEYIEKISLYLMSNLGKPVSLYGLGRESPIGMNTIHNYLSYMEKCFLLFFLKKFDFSVRKQNANPRKVYAVDPALARRVSFKFSEDKGRILENIVFIELKRRRCEVYYHKAKRECDFLVKDGLKIIRAIQVCWEINEDNRKREIEGLSEAIEMYKLDKGICITYDQEMEMAAEEKKIIIMPLWKWLVLE